MENFDTIVIGCGGMGSSATYHLAGRGVKTLTLERFALNHTNGSSHGKTRIIRHIYDYPWYVPLVRRASDLWTDLEKESGKRIMRITGGLFVGPADHEITRNRVRIAEMFAVPHRVMTSREIDEVFSIFKASESETGLYDSNAGILFPENCIEAYVSLAKERGAEFHFNETALKWERVGEKLVVTASRDSYSADKLVISAGGWTKTLIPVPDIPLTSERQVVFWIKPLKHGEMFEPTRMPVFGWLTGDLRGYYGLPDLGDGLKVALDHFGESCSPETIDRRVTATDERPIRNFLSEHLPLGDGEILSSTTCLYTNTPDSHFLLDFLPHERNVLLVSPCSGHGFKFSSVVGEIVSDLAIEGSTRHDISRFRIDRFRS
jgi:sarcosine oxidase